MAPTGAILLFHLLTPAPDPELNSASYGNFEGGGRPFVAIGRLELVTISPAVAGPPTRDPVTAETAFTAALQRD